MQLEYSVLYTIYQVPFYLWRIELERCKVPKYYDRDCTFSPVFQVTVEKNFELEP